MPVLSRVVAQVFQRAAQVLQRALEQVR